MSIIINTPSVTINQTSTCDLGPVLNELQSLHQKINQMATQLEILQEKATALQTQVTDLQATVDTEQAQIAELLATNATVVNDLNAQIAALVAQQATMVDPAALQPVIDTLTATVDSLAITKADLEATV